MSEEMMNTKEVARYLEIHEKQVYALIKTGRMQARQKSGRISGALLASGSNDPVLDILQTCLRKAHPEFFIFSANTGSTEGLTALEKGYTDIAWSHLLDPETGEYNIPYLEKLVPSVKAVVVNIFFRELGFLTAPGNPMNITGFEDLAREGVRFVNRQAGSGTRLLLDYHLGRVEISPDRIAGYEQEVFTHFEVGLAILSGGADTGIATVAVANLLGLAFSPITRERFDMICDQSVFFQKGVQALVEALTGDVFRKRVEKLGSYDFKSAGRILYVKP